MENIVNLLLENRGVDKKTFINPIPPKEISLKELGINESLVAKAIKRIMLAKKENQGVIVYGDYDADGICATAILWQALYKLGLKVLPHIPERFSEGYGMNKKTIEALKEKDPNLKLVITVDNGIVAVDEVEFAKSLGVDVIVTDHHTKADKLPNAHSLIHTVKIGGAAVAWVLARELGFEGNLELACIGTVADQLPLTGVNRSLAKYGLEDLNSTRNTGLLELFKEAGVQKGNLGTYDINFVIAPRINAMGRLAHAIDSLRLLCTRDNEKARALASKLGKTNLERQKIVDEVLVHAKKEVGEEVTAGIIVLSHESYHEGVVGLAAAKLVERFFRPAIVFSEGKTHAKASARSIPGVNIIELVRGTNLITAGGGHPMAAGFTIETKNLSLFTKKMQEAVAPLLTDEILFQKITIDMELDFDQINWELSKKLSEFTPFGLGNPVPTFVTFGVEVLDARRLGENGKHLKLKLKKANKVFDAIGFGLGSHIQGIAPKKQIDLVYSIEKNIWNGNASLQLKVKDVKFS